jgi:CRISPR system Cascade subunit CasC
MNDTGVKIEIHLIQNFAPSNLNRDDTGQPKSATFGGFRRARISSQCGKRAAREWWRERGTVSVGDRTKRLQQMIGDILAKDEEFKKKVAAEEDMRDGIRVFTEAYYAGSDKKKLEHTNVLVFIGPDEADICAQAVKDLWDDKTKETAKKSKQGTVTVKGIASIVNEVRQFDAKHKKDTSEDADEAEEMTESEQGGDEAVAEDAAAKQKAKRPKLIPLKEIEDRIKAAQVSADIALFGRMLAEQPGRNTDGACQVAHPISTHKVDMEMDSYTAVDDLNPVEETGAGMMGVVGFNSACYYRYALVDRDQLARNLARKTKRQNGDWAQSLEPNDYDEADNVIKAFLEAMVFAIPTGKQNSFAAQNLPSFGLFVVRRKGGVPVSLANAFAKPVRPMKDDDDLVGLSVDRLTKHWDSMQKVYGEQGVQATACFHVGQDSRMNGLSGSDKGTVEKAIDAVMAEAKKP